ncbi:hypothetical protein ACFQE1_04670 [Halobium palmae]|uniref:Uncharacterized protein n=1 Tax=Halobium palmae TaxID=1776492 RepID=A0ABD5RXD7_9EURY
MSENTTRHNVPGVEPREYERNLYFHGKLITVRDMNLEQAYHLGRLNSHTRYVSGQGVLTGLDTTATWDAATDELTIAVHPGVAYDCYGMPIVVENRATETRTLGDETTVYVSIRGRDCKEELVPATGAENACADDCEYSHIRESFEVVVSTEEPASEDPPLSYAIPEVQFPSKSDVGEDAQAAFRAVSRNYYENDAHYADEESPAGTIRVDGPPSKPCDDPAVFLAAYSRSDGDSDDWTLSGDPFREEIHPNHKTWSGLLRHALDFENPHQVHLGLESIDGGARVDVVGSEEEEGHVDLLAGGENVTVAVNGRQVTLSVEAEAGEPQEPEDLDGLRRYVMLRTLTAKVDSYPTVQEEFPNSVLEQSAGQIIKFVESKLEPDAFQTEATYKEIVTRVAEIERRMAGQDANNAGELGQATTLSRKRFREAVDNLEAALTNGSTVDVAVTQDWVCEAAERLQRRRSVNREDSIEDILFDDDEDLVVVGGLIREHTTATTANDVLERDPQEFIDELEAAINFEESGVSPDDVVRFRERVEERVVTNRSIGDLVDVDEEVLSALNSEGVTTAGELVNADLRGISDQTGVNVENLFEVMNNVELFRPRR